MALTEMGPTYAKQALDAGDGGAVNVLAFVSLHSGATGTTGANEITDTGYARQACSWNAAAGTTTVTKTNSSTLSFTTIGTEVTDAGTSSAVTGGTFGIQLALDSPVSADTITVAAGALSIGASG